MARSKKVADDRRENILRIRLTDEERRQLDMVAGEKTLDTSTWARSVLLSLSQAESQPNSNGRDSAPAGSRGRPKRGSK